MTEAKNGLAALADRCNAAASPDQSGYYGPLSGLLRECETVLRLAASPPAMKEALALARSEIVLAIAFLGRDKGTDRINGTIDSLIARLVKADAAALASLDAPAKEAAAPDAWVVQLKYGPDRWSGDMLTDFLPSNTETYRIIRPLYAAPPLQAPADSAVRDSVVQFLKAWDSLPVGDHSVAAISQWLNSNAIVDGIIALRAALTAPAAKAVEQEGVSLPPKDFARVSGAIHAARDVLRGYANIDYDTDNNPQPNFAFDVEQQCKEALHVLDECNAGFSPSQIAPAAKATITPPGASAKPYFWQKDDCDGDPRLDGRLCRSFYISMEKPKHDEDGTAIPQRIWTELQAFIQSAAQCGVTDAPAADREAVALAVRDIDDVQIRELLDAKDVGKGRSLLTQIVLALHEGK